MCFLSTIFPNAPAHPPLYFLTSPLVQKSIICEDVIMYFKYTITILKVYLAYTFFTQQQYTFSTLCCVLKVYLFSMRLGRLLYTCNVKYSTEKFHVSCTLNSMQK